MHLAGPYPRFGLRSPERMHLDERFTREISADRPRHVTVVVVDHGNWNLSRFRGTAIAAEYVAEESGNQDRDDNADDHGASIGRMEAQVIPDQRPNGNGAHGCPASGASRKACPVNAMKTSSRLTCAVCTDVTCRP